MANETTVEGLDELIKALNEFGPDVMPHIRQTVEVATQSITLKAKEKAAQYTQYSQTGALVASLRTKTTRLKKTDTKTLSYVTWGDDVRDFAAPLELGHDFVSNKGKITGHAAPHPFLRPAADEKKEEYIDTIIGGMNHAMDLMGGKKE